jgi:hypothetical protein
LLQPAADGTPQDLMVLIDVLHRAGNWRHPRLGAVALSQ